MATIKSYRELVCWQLSVELRRGMIDVTDRPEVKRNFKFCQQVGESTRSAPANIAEGFKRSNRVFMQHLDIALGSLQETENHVDEALERKYISPQEHLHFRTIAKRAIRAAEELKAYLRRSTPPGRYGETRPNPTKPDRTRPNLNQPDQPDQTRPNLNQPDQTRPNPPEPDQT
jgi:four helix bundle protein